MKNWPSNGLTIAGKIEGKKFAYQLCLYLLTFRILLPVVAEREKNQFSVYWTGFATSIFSLNDVTY